MKQKIKAGLFSILFLIGFTTIVVGQNSKKVIGKKELRFQNWHNLDIKKNKTLGISTDRAYNELLKGKTATRVIVAVIDGGVDINHEDLKNKIWVNTKEIPGNGIDDDYNGYVDDINGWNFLGGANGENVSDENLELTRLYKTLSAKYAGKDITTISEVDKPEFEKYGKIQIKYLEESGKAKDSYDNFEPTKRIYFFADSLVRAVLGKEDYTISDLRKLKTKQDFTLRNVKEVLLKSQRKGFSRNDILEYSKYLRDRVDYHYNLQFNPREIVGDNPNDFADKVYGNNDVIGPDSYHGTFVSGIIAAERNNDLGIKGIADSVKIMVLRAVPNGDEYDKDIANAILYAVHNGAQIINCSFGKSYSPNKQFVDSALRIAQEKGVLIVHAAGNDAQDNDSVANFPSRNNNFGNSIIDNWINVGASSLKANKDMVASFSNYGKTTVDIFAPGYRIYSTKPGNKYDVADGTSFSSPMVAGAAALLKSVYPQLTASQIKEILFKSGKNYSKLSVFLPNEAGFKNKSNMVDFGELSITGSVLNVYEALKMAGQYNAN